MLQSVGEMVVVLSTKPDSVRVRACISNDDLGLCGNIACSSCAFDSKENLQKAARYVKNGRIT